MEVVELLQQLREQNERMSRAIAALEELQEDGFRFQTHVARGRGRKSMGPAERSVVSARMKRYWAERRSEKIKETATG